jgi:hypothetical protein
MPHVAELHDVPTVVLLDRRRTPDRRATWRGGRRDTDWINRPPDSLARMNAPLFVTWWRRFSDRLGQ